MTLVRFHTVLALVAAILAAGGCRNPGNGAAAANGKGAASRPAADGPSSAALAALDRLTSESGLNVPRASLPALADETFIPWRKRMVELHIKGSIRDGRAPVRDPRVHKAMEFVPRHEFVTKTHRPNAYIDSPLPLTHGQTISQPYIVAFMTDALKPKPTDRILEIGTGSGYQAAVLAVLVKEVYTIEIVKPLGERARKTLERLGYDNVHVRIGDGYRGWPEKAPFDGVIVTAAPERIPKPLIEQLKVGGRLILPVGPVRGYQELKVVRKTETGTLEESVRGVRFVPMVGEVEKEPGR